MEVVTDIIKYIVLGIVQGLTEFLPVSSSGHLILLERLGIGEASVLFNLMLHLSTLAAVALVMRKELGNWIKHPLSREAKWIYILTLPTIAIAFCFSLFFEDLLLGAMLPTGFLITAFFLILGSVARRKESVLNFNNAFLTGIAQGIAVLPGVSRSGMTITVMTALGIDREKAVKLSFLMSVPIIVGGAVWEGIKGGFVLDCGLIPLVAGMLSAFFSGYIALQFMVKRFGALNYLPFAVYTFLLGILSYGI